jgi:alpha-galactosidase
LDARDVPFEQSLRDVSQWWEGLPGCAPVPVPDATTLPVYSTWCAFFQEPGPVPVLDKNHLARELRCGTVILGNGWQTMHANLAYAYCGDWEDERIGDMAAFVRSVHDLGMRCMLWYPIAMIGHEAKVWPRFEGKVIRNDPGWRGDARPTLPGHQPIPRRRL